jgi:hypothetical protein
MNVTIVCPACGEEIEAEMHRERGDRVPYGSTRARLPDTVDIDYDHDCPDLNRDMTVKLDCMFYDAFDTIEANSWPESQYDTTAERNMDRDL